MKVLSAVYNWQCMLCSSCRAFSRLLTSWEVVFLLFVANMLYCHTYSDVLPDVLPVLFLSVTAARVQQTLTATPASINPPRPYRSNSSPSNPQLASAEPDTGRHGAQAQVTDTTGHQVKGTYEVMSTRYSAFWHAYVCVCLCAVLCTRVLACVCM